MRGRAAGEAQGAKKTPAKALAIPERSRIPRAMKWNPGILFRSIASWDKERRRLLEALPKLSRFQGKLGRSPAHLARALQAIDRLALRLEKVSAYASRLYDTDVRQSAAQGQTAAAEQLYTEFRRHSHFLEPELLALPESELRSLARDPLLVDYDRYLEQLIKNRPHVLSEPEEQLLAGASALGNGSYNTYKTLTSAELEYPTFVDEAGQTVELSPAMYSRYRQSPHRGERRQAFELFWGNHHKIARTCSRTLVGQLTYYDFTARARNYDSALDSALEPWEIPTSFYTQLIGKVTEHLDLFHRYLALRKRLLGIEGKQHYYDVYTMPVAQGQRRYSFDRARQLIRRSLKPLGRAYQKVLNEALAHGSGWMDVYPNQGKRSGAYSSSVYGKHPLVLLNYNDDFDSLSTTAHELGHAIHSQLSNEAQPYAKADYSLFNAEVASIFNETLLIEYLLEREKNPDERRFLLAAYLDSFRGTVFRQTMFAEFELGTYRRLAKGQALTADSLNSAYLRLLRRYHGHADGVMNIAPLYGIEWAYIPHFYYHYYVYQYVSGFIAATALAGRVLSEGRPAAQRYIENMLKAGCSADPLDILKRSGVNLMTARPYQLAMRQFSKRLRELERLAPKG